MEGGEGGRGEQTSKHNKFPLDCEIMFTHMYTKRTTIGNTKTNKPNIHAREGPRGGWVGGVVEIMCAILNWYRALLTVNSDIAVARIEIFLLTTCLFLTKPLQVKRNNDN